jgi:hypothetical protein
MHFDFFAAVTAPFRMQPGLRRLAAGAAQLSPLAPGSRHQREKLAVLSSFWPQALLCADSFDAGPALAAVCRQAALEHPQAWAWDGRTAHARLLGAAVQARSGEVQQTAEGVFGLGDEVSRCLAGLPAAWRLAGLLSLAFAEDLAVVDGRDGRIPWLAVALPSHWAPETKVGQHFASVHAPVADNGLLLRAADALTRLVSGPERWERFVWNVTDQPRLHTHPDARRSAPLADHGGGAGLVAHRTPDLHPPARPRPGGVHDRSAGPAAGRRAGHAGPRPGADAAIASMSPAVLAYRNLALVREPLLAWLASLCAPA